MKKQFFALSALLATMSAYAVKDASECENLTPYWDFTQAETALKASHGAEAGIYNLNGGGGNFYTNKKSSLDFSNGYLAVNGTQPTQNANLDNLNKSFQLVDLQGTCGKVWVFNFSQSQLQSKLEDLGFNYELQSGTLGNGASGNMYNLYFIPAPMVYENSKKLRCRVELNIYHATNDDTSTLHIYAEKDEKNAVDASNTPIATGVWGTVAESAIKASQFRNEEGEWDPTKWMVYDFPITEGTPATHPHIKFQVYDRGKQDHAVLIRSIKFYAPYEDGEAVPAVTSESLLSNFASYQVKRVLPFDTLEPNAGVTGENLTPELDFNTYEGFPISLASLQPWNGDNSWEQHSNYDLFKDGAFCFSYNMDIAEASAAAMAKGVSKIDLGGDCGPVAIINYKGSALQSLLREMIDEDMVVPQSEANNPNQINIFRKYDSEITGNLTVRIEFNVYSPNVISTFDICGHGGGADITYDESAMVSSDYFTDINGIWDPTKWVVREFTIPALNPDNHKPMFLKYYSPGIANGALLIRSIQFIQHGDEVVDYKHGVMYPLTSVVHTVGKVEHPVKVNDENLDVLELIKNGQEVTEGHSITFTVPEQYDLHVMVQHSAACGHSSHKAAQRNVASRADEDSKYSDEYVNHGQSYVYVAPAMGHSEVLSLKAVNRITAQEYPLFESQSVTSNITTGVDAVDAEAAEANAVMYSLQGIVVDPSTATPGVYLERRGNTIRKVVVK